MKNLIFAMAALCLILSSCQKDEAILNPTGSETTSVQLDNIPLIANPHNVSDYALNPEDAEDEKISKQLLQIGLVARGLFNNNAYNELMINEAKKNSNNCVSIEKFIESAQGNSANKNEADFEDLAELVRNADFTYQPQEEGEAVQQYTPAFFVVNAKNADATKRPLIALGTSVDDELSGMDQFTDYIVAWYANGDGSFEEILINEETAMNTTHPIYILDNAQFASAQPSKSNSKLETFEQGELKGANSSTMQVIDRYKIAHRYDGSKRSEYSYKLEYWMDGNPSAGGNRTLIKDIHKNDINDYFYNDVDIWQLNHVTVTGLSMATFEYDWYASNKCVTTPGDGANAEIDCRMKYSHEYYQRVYFDVEQNWFINYVKGAIAIKKG